jgi:acetyl-CoA hydrolase
MVMEMSAEFRSRVRSTEVLKKFVTPEGIIPYFKDGMILGFSGFIEGHPKMTGAVLADHVEKNGLQGKLGFTILSGASIGLDIDDRWASLRMIKRRFPFQLTKVLNKQVNAGEVQYGDQHLSRYAQEIANGFYTLNNDGKIDIAVVEASAITEDGGIVPTLSGGALPEILSRADKLIVEINTTLPSFEGLHDFVPVHNPPHNQPLLLTSVEQRIGTTYVPCDPSKIVAIIESDKKPMGRDIPAPNEASLAIGAPLVEFLKHEVKMGRLTEELLPLQFGGGHISNAVFHGLAKEFSGFKIWTEVITDGFLDAIDQGKVDAITCTGLCFTNAGMDRVFSDFERYSKNITIRQASVSNGAEAVRRLGVICINTPAEIDIYAHVNSTMVNGSRMMNGVGGSGDFMRNAYLSIMLTPSTIATKSDPTGITRVLPMLAHVDHTEHEMHVVGTEQGIADLRGLVPREKAQLIIDNCVHPDYQPIIQDYFDRATHECKAKGAMHQPHMLQKVFKMQKNLEEHGTMKINNWD